MELESLSLKTHQNNFLYLIRESRNYDMTNKLIMICSQSMNALITKLYDQQANGQTEKDAAIYKAANIIKSEVQLIPPNKDIYPSPEK